MNVAEMMAQALKGYGVQRAYGVIGGGVAHMVSALNQVGITIHNCRHESGAAFMACEDYHATGVPPVVFMTTGPGFTNAITGLAAATWESAKVLVITGASNVTHLDKISLQDTNDRFLNVIRPTLGPGAETAVSYCWQPSNCQQLLDRWINGLPNAAGFIGVAMVPLDVQKAEAKPYTPRINPAPESSNISEGFLKDIAKRLQKGKTWFWLGWGARHYTETIRSIVSHLDAKVICSPRAKGVYPETSKNFIGVTGFAGSIKVVEELEENPPENMVILGTRLNEFTAFWDSKYTPKNLLVHVDVDPKALTHNFMSVPKIAVQEHIGTFLAELITHLDSSPKDIINNYKNIPFDGNEKTEGIHPGWIMKCVQKQVVNNNYRVLAEPGNAFAWAIHWLQFDNPNFRTSTTFSSMGHFSAGVVGAAIASQKKILAITGDGSALMNNEISTAVKYNAPCIWLILNDAGYGMVRHGFKALNLENMDFDIPRVDFVQFAYSQGASGTRVINGQDLPAAIDEALAFDGPFVIDVHINPVVEPPNELRNKALKK